MEAADELARYGALLAPKQRNPVVHILDNIDPSPLHARQQSMDAAQRAGFCVGYFDLRRRNGLAEHAGRSIGEDASRDRPSDPGVLLAGADDCNA